MNERGAEVWAQRGQGPEWSGIRKALRPDEEEAIQKLWMKMSGDTCWLDAFMVWAGAKKEERDYDDVSARVDVEAFRTFDDKFFGIR
jgi:hypothetical protein